MSWIHTTNPKLEDPEIFRNRIKKINSDIEELEQDKKILEEKIEEHQKYWGEYRSSCYICGSDQDKEGHHFIPRGTHGGHRRHFQETILLCRRCHRNLHGRYKQIEFDESPSAEKDRLRELIEKKFEYEFVLQAIELIEEMREEFVRKTEEDKQ